jgi:predicted nucleic acid-binding protein
MGKPIKLERLLDSVILIDHLNNIDQATRFIAGLDPMKTAISVISLAEILVGLEGPFWEKGKILLDQYHLLVIDGPVAEKAAALRRKHGWKLPDAFQASLAIHHNLRLCTRNTKDFDPVTHPFVEIPYLV